MKQFPWKKKQHPQSHQREQEQEREITNLKKRVLDLEREVVQQNMNIVQPSLSLDDSYVRCMISNQEKVYIPLKAIFALWEADLATRVNAKAPSRKMKAQTTSEL